MPSKPTGSIRFRDGRWRARVTLGKTRPELILTTCKPNDEAKAAERTQVLADMATQLARAGRFDVALPLLERAASRDGKALADVVEAAKRVCSGDATPVSTLVTFAEFAERWTSGKLAARYPDHVKSRNYDHERARLAKYVNTLVGSVLLRDFTIDHADAVMSALPSTLSRASRRHVAQTMSRVLNLAVFPARLIPASPLPKGYLPQLGPQKAKGYLYPDEDARLLAATAIDLPHRLLYGFLSREGLRWGELPTWRDLDLDRGSIRLDVNKTDDARAWALDPGVVEALKAYRTLRGNPDPDEAVFAEVDGVVVDRGGEIAETFREHLRVAGIDRPELFERSASRLPIRLHDLRSTFITISLANGRSETWVADRTGHKSSAMINRYRRTARHFAELNLGTLRPLIDAIPELRVASSSAARADVGRDVGRDSRDAAADDAENGESSGDVTVMPRDRIELPTRGFSTRSEHFLHRLLNAGKRKKPTR
jgi:integrase/mRNA-degrading endonuclease toxin of MazEF toxin-antitoxin module